MKFALIYVYIFIGALQYLKEQEMNYEEKQILKKWKNAGLANDFIFNKVMQDKSITLEVLRRTLPNLHINTIKRITNQQELLTGHDVKGVRLDIYVEDDQCNHYDIEMQVIDKYNLPERIRFYHSNLAMSCYEKGQNYATADNSYVIFFCCFDPFGFGDQEYQIDRSLRKHPDFAYDDGEHTRVFDVTSLQKNVSPKLQRFLDVIAKRRVVADDDFIVKLKERITFVKHNREWRREYMQRSLYEMDIENSINRAKSQGLEEGLNKGEAKAETSERIALIQGLIDIGQSHEQIIDFLVKIRHFSVEQAESYYKAATE